MTQNRINCLLIFLFCFFSKSCVPAYLLPGTEATPPDNFELNHCGYNRRSDQRTFEHFSKTASFVPALFWWFQSASKGDDDCFYLQAFLCLLFENLLMFVQTQTPSVREASLVLIYFIHFIFFPPVNLVATRKKILVFRRGRSSYVYTFFYRKQHGKGPALQNRLI